MRKSRPVDPNKQLRRLEKKHEALKERVRELESHFLTSDQHIEKVRLKKEKLKAKDLLHQLRDSQPAGALA